jgi:hypothetical protein
MDILYVFSLALSPTTLNFRLHKQSLWNKCDLGVKDG